MHRLQTIQNHLFPVCTPSSSSNTILDFQTVSSSNSKNIPIVLEKSVADALRNGNPVVALESTIITHGMPYPENIRTAKRVEQVVRENGSTPATIAILKGVIHVGLTNDELDYLGKLHHDEVVKCSRRDLAYVLAKKLNGATTVAGTIVVASMVGISVFVTGGIGGVHKGVESTWDISADLTELARNSIAVVCAGVKSILDIPKTLEHLETGGVSVCGYQTDEFPSFFTSRSGCKVPCMLRDSTEAAELIDSNFRLKLDSGVVIGVPVPAHEEAKNTTINKAIEDALEEAKKNKVEGRDITPFLLKRINELTEGDSLRANIALILNNAKVGSQIASELSKIRKQTFKVPAQIYSTQNFQTLDATDQEKFDIILFGGAVVDLSSFPKEKLYPKTSNPGTILQSIGGVANNVASTLKILQLNPLLVTAVGNDSFGTIVKNHFTNLNLSLSGVKTSMSHSTAIYNCIVDESGEMQMAVSSMDIFKEAVSIQDIQRFEAKLDEAKVVFLDTNLAPEVLDYICTVAQKHQIQVFVDPISIAKCRSIVNCLEKISFLKPNEQEVQELVNLFLSKSGKPTTPINSRSLHECLQILVEQAKVKHILLSAGAKGIFYATKRNGKISIEHYPAIPIQKIASVTGAGDSFSSGFLFGLIQQKPISDCIQMGLKCAYLKLTAPQSINFSLSREQLI